MTSGGGGTGLNADVSGELPTFQGLFGDGVADTAQEVTSGTEGDVPNTVDLEGLADVEARGKTINTGVAQRRGL